MPLQHSDPDSSFASPHQCSSRLTCRSGVGLSRCCLGHALDITAAQTKLRLLLLAVGWPECNESHGSQQSVICWTENSRCLTLLVLHTDRYRPDRQPPS